MRKRVGKERNKKLQFFIWTIFGIIFLSGLMLATTTITDNAILTTGNINSTTLNVSNLYIIGKICNASNICFTVDNADLNNSGAVFAGYANIGLTNVSNIWAGRQNFTEVNISGLMIGNSTGFYVGIGNFFFNSSGEYIAGQSINNTISLIANLSSAQMENLSMNQVMNSTFQDLLNRSIKLNATDPNIVWLNQSNTFIGNVTFFNGVFTNLTVGQINITTYLYNSSGARFTLNDLNNTGAVFPGYTNIALTNVSNNFAGRQNFTEVNISGLMIGNSTGFYVGIGNFFLNASGEYIAGVNINYTINLNVNLTMNQVMNFTIAQAINKTSMIFNGNVSIASPNLLNVSNFFFANSTNVGIGLNNPQYVLQIGNLVNAMNISGMLYVNSSGVGFGSYGNGVYINSTSVYLGGTWDMNKSLGNYINANNQTGNAQVLINNTNIQLSNLILSSGIITLNASTSVLGPACNTVTNHSLMSNGTGLYYCASNTTWALLMPG